MSSKKSIRVLVVDDSALIREIISDMIVAADGLELVGTANDGLEALTHIEQLRPDVVTLDIQMPGMGGLETLEQILKRDPIPVIMVSALAQRAADVTLQALERGALDYVAKPNNVNAGLEDLRVELLQKIRKMAGTDVRRVLQIRKARNQRRDASRKSTRVSEEAVDHANEDFIDCCVAIGISTGGPPALTGMFESLRPPMPPIVVVQHMPGLFTAPFAKRLNSISQLTIKEAAAGDILRPNCVFVAQGGKHLYLKRIGNLVKTQVRDAAPVSGHKPSVDVMMQCASEVFRDRCLGVIMTGMGRDGSDGCGIIKSGGGYVLGQDEDTSDVYGMNKVAFVEGHVDHQFSLDDAAMIVKRQVKRLFGKDKLVAH